MPDVVNVCPVFHKVTFVFNTCKGERGLFKSLWVRIINCLHEQEVCVLLKGKLLNNMYWQICSKWHPYWTLCFVLNISQKALVGPRTMFTPVVGLARNYHSLLKILIPDIVHPHLPLLNILVCRTDVEWMLDLSTCKNIPFLWMLFSLRIINVYIVHHSPSRSKLNFLW